MAINAMGVNPLNNVLTQTWNNDSQLEASKEAKTPVEWVKQADWITGVKTMTKKAVSTIWDSEKASRDLRNKAEGKWQNISVMA